MPLFTVPLPSGFNISVKEGDQVSAGSVLAKKKFREEVIDISSELSIHPRRATKTLKKSPGQKVKVGDVIAVTKKLFVLKKELRSKVDGVIMRYERDSGKLFVRTSYESITEKILSPVAGLITLCDNEQIILKTNSKVLAGKIGTGARGEGEVFFLDPDLYDGGGNSLYLLDSKASGKVIVGRNLTRDILLKAIGLGATGVIGVVSEGDMEYIKERKLITPVIMTEHDTINELVSLGGKKVLLDGSSAAIVIL